MVNPRNELDLHFGTVSAVAGEAYYNIADNNEEKHYLTGIVANLGQNDVIVSVQGREVGGTWRTVSTHTFVARSTRPFYFYLQGAETQYRFVGYTAEGNTTGAGGHLRAVFVDLYGAIGGY